MTDTDNSKRFGTLTLEPEERSCPACGTPSEWLRVGSVTAHIDDRQLGGEPSDHRFQCKADCPVVVFEGRSTDTTQP